MPRRKRLVTRPSCEPVESRDLLSVIPILMSEASKQSSPSTVIALASAGELDQPPSNASGQASSLVGQTPTPHEARRERFRAVYAGPITVGPGRFTDQAQQFFVRGTGFSTDFGHGDLQMLVIIPTDPNAQFTGTVVMQDQNTASSGLLAIDVQGNRAGLGPDGMPRFLTWSVSPFAGAGSFTAGPFSLAYGQGTIVIKPGPPQGRSGHAFHGQPTVTVTINGTLFTPGLFNPLQNAGLIVSHHRII
jgi:hypothetical protein